MKEIAINRFTGFSALYDDVRPKPSKKICEIAQHILYKKEINRLADLGCGTGISTHIWKEYVSDLIGIEPNTDMIKYAENKYKDLKFIQANSYETGLESDSVDIITCSQSFHWMEPESTLEEINRILKKNGLLLIYDCCWPVSISESSETAYKKLFAEVKELSEKYKSKLPREKQWPKNKHLENLMQSSYFEYTNQIHFDQFEDCDAERFTGIALSQGALQTLLKNQIHEIDAHIDNFRKIVMNDIKNPTKMLINYNLIYGRK